MERISKPPEVRRQEIIHTAMRVFYKKGYYASSMADIANEMKVVPGLCYRYFKSKQELFDTAMQQYIEECAAPFLCVFEERGCDFRKKLERLGDLFQSEEKYSRYHEFFHRPGNEALHIMLSVRMTQYILPSLCEDLKWQCRMGYLNIEQPELMAKFLLGGIIALLQEQPANADLRLHFLQQAAERLLLCDEELCV
jgi:AcrR family transcriptional regulator